MSGADELTIAVIGTTILASLLTWLVVHFATRLADAVPPI